MDAGDSDRFAVPPVVLALSAMDRVVRSLVHCFVDPQVEGSGLDDPWAIQSASTDLGERLQLQPENCFVYEVVAQ